MMNNHEVPQLDLKKYDIRKLSPEELGRLGVSQIAYIKTVQVDGTAMTAIHAADGRPMAITETYDGAIAAILQNEMMPILVH
jgi:hypothetical protein